MITFNNCEVESSVRAKINEAINKVNCALPFENIEITNGTIDDAMIGTNGDTIAQADIASQKQKLRDVTKNARIESAITPEELKALTFDVLVS